jgi:2-polyprenyl-6-methoxyphenol hydroxylase-like FAD-dependent oxidoreductase
MPTAVIAGASIAGLASALALHGAGYRAILLERSAPPPEGPPGEVAGEWRRTTVPQAVHSHTLTSLGVRTLRERAPQVLAAALAAGARLLDLTGALPPGVSDRVRKPGDEELVALACRRTTFELVLYRAVRALPGVDIRHGTSAVALRLDASQRRARGLVTDSGATIDADLVVDATGVRGAARRWLADAGVHLDDDQVHPSGLSGFTRIYRRASGRPLGPLGRGNAAGDLFDHYVGVLHPGDNDTFSIALCVLPGDRLTAGLRDENAFTAVASATPGLGPWLEDARPISPVYAINSPPNTLRSAAISRAGRVAGLFSVGDAACVTNPAFGRGMSLALAQAFRLGDVLATLPDPGEAQSEAAARAAEALLRPWYESSVSADRDRIARWRAAVSGAASTPPVTTSATESSPRASLAEVVAAARSDATVWRGLVRVLMSLATPEQVFDESFTALVRQAPRLTSDPRPQAPGRAELVRLIAQARGAPG